MVIRNSILILSFAFLVGCPNPPVPQVPAPSAFSVDTSTTEVALSAMGGASNDGFGSIVTYASITPLPALNWWDQLKNHLMSQLLPVAEAYNMSCSGGSMTPSVYSQATTSYSWSPVVCAIGFTNGASSTTSWTGSYNYLYGTGCSGTDFPIPAQPPTCSIVRSTLNGSGTPGPVIRSLIGYDGNLYDVSHDTTSPGGYDTTVTVSNAGQEIDCGIFSFGDTYCSERTVSIAGSHVTATVTPSGGSTPSPYWDQTVSTSVPLVVTGVNYSKGIASGQVIVQNNLNQFTATITVVNDLAYGLANCCFPTAGQLLTTFNNGPYAGQTLITTFSASCGEAVMSLQTDVPGVLPFPITFQHCL